MIPFGLKVFQGWNDDDIPMSLRRDLWQAYLADPGHQ